MARTDHDVFRWNLNMPRGTGNLARWGPISLQIEFCIVHCVDKAQRP